MTQPWAHAKRAGKRVPNTKAARNTVNFLARAFISCGCMSVSFLVIRHTGARAQPNERTMTISSTPLCVHNWNILDVE